LAGASGSSPSCHEESEGPRAGGMDRNDRGDRDDGKLRLLNPLSIRFSQSRIAPQFRDGHLLEEASAQVYEAPLDVSAHQLAVTSAPSDSAAGPPPYDVVLVPPFPLIRVISWRPKLRSADGEAQRDKNGDVVLGKRNWFALDNRRLQSMQRAAAKRWPRRCCVVVRCIEEVPGQTIRELRKFRTTTEGRSVDIGFHFGDSKPWSWAGEAPPGALGGGESCPEVPPEGYFTEELWDASLWAPHAVAVSNHTIDVGPGDDEAFTESVPAVPSKARAAIDPMPSECASAPMSTSGRRQQHVGGVPRHCILVNCPATGWEYIDPSGKVQGPFDLAKMRAWHQHGFFYAALPMRCDSADEFAPFAQLWPMGAQPFTTQVIRHRQ